MLGEIALPEAVLAEAGSYHMHPALLDACLQIVAWAMPSSQDVYLPLSIERFTLYRHPQPALWSHAVIRPDSDLKAGALKGDLRIMDADGVVAELEGIYFRRVAGIAHKPVFADWLYETDWQPKPLAGQGTGFFPQPEALAGQMAQHVPALAAHYQLERFTEGLLPELEALSISYILQAFEQLGWQPRVGDQFSTGALASRLRIAPQHQRLFGRMLEMLAEEGILQAVGADWQVREARAAGVPRLHHEVLVEEYPENHAELTLTAWAGDHLAEALTGAVDGVSLLFQDGGETAGRMYVDSPAAHVFNNLLRDTLSAALANRPAGYPLRVLEIGAGTGGTTAFILPMLPAGETAYTYTDISPVLVEKAREKFGTYPFVEYQVMNIEQDPAQQGLSGREFDLIIAANVIHATADLSQTLGHVRQLLAPEGTLCMIEVTSRQRWLDITFGLTDGWWRFTDSDVRESYPLLSQAEWLRVFEANGFSAAAVLPEAGTPFDIQGMMIVRGPDKAPAAQPATDAGEWLIFADSGGIGHSVAEHLRQRGEAVCVVTASEVNLADVDDLKALVTDGLRHVLHLWSLDLEAPDDATARSLVPDQLLNSGSLMHLVQALGSAGVSPRLWMVTRGAQPINGGTSPAQATTWGIGKVVALEHPEFRSVCLDLDPAWDTDACVQALLAEIGVADSESQLAYRGDSRYAARLSRRPVAPILAAPQPFHIEKSPGGILDDIALVPNERRAPGSGEVEIQVFAAGLNFRDVMNALAMRDDPDPLGGECSGKIVAVGEGVEGLEVGDSVIAIANGCFGAYVTDRADLVLPKPRNMTDEQAAAFPLVFLTAHYALNHLARLAPGERVLIHAAAGGVGMAAVQLARAAGAEIFGTAGTPEKRALLASMGVHHVLDSRSLSFADEIMRLTNGEGVDVVLNSLAGDFIPASLNVLAPQGRFLEIGKRDIWSADDVARVRPQASYFIIDLSVFIKDEPAFIRAMFTELLEAVRDGLYIETPVTAFPMQAAADAFRYMAQARHTGKIVLTLDENRHAAGLTIRPEASYLITGGLAGLGLLTARWLAEQGARHLVLMGRSRPTDEARRAIADIEAQGVAVFVAQGDVSQAEQVAAVLARIAPDTPLRGVIHSAGALEDGALLRQEWGRFVKPMAAKVDGAWNLHVLTQNQPLDFFVMYSSVAALLGSTGQANHAAANAFMDTLAYYRRARGLPAISINWGAWAETGAAVDYNVGERISAQGVSMIPPQDGLASLRYLMIEDAAQVGVSPINWSQFMRQFSSGGVPAWLSRMAAEVNSAKASADRAAPAPKAQQAELLAQLEQATPDRQYDLLTTYVSDQVAKVLGMESGQAVDPSTPLNEMGLDSLMAVELRNRLTASLGLKRNLPATLVFDYPSVEALASYLFQDVLGLGAEAEEPELNGNPVDTLSSIEELSDEEVDRLLKDRGLS